MKTWVKVAGTVVVGISGGLWWQFIMTPTIVLGVIAGVMIAIGSYLVLVYPIPTNRK